MHIISRKKIRDFAKLHPESSAALDAWYRHAKRAAWLTFHDVQAMFGHADVYEQYVIFNIGGNKYRLIAEVNYPRGKVFIRFVLTHADYSRNKWKDA